MNPVERRRRKGGGGKGIALALGSSKKTLLNVRYKPATETSFNISIVDKKINK